jgi:integrase
MAARQLPPTTPALLARRQPEVVALDLADHDRQAGSLKIRGKGNKERLAYLAVGPQAALDDWLELRGEAPGPPFWPIFRSGRLYGSPLYTCRPTALRRLARPGVRATGGPWSAGRYDRRAACPLGRSASGAARVCLGRVMRPVR